jgi:hypothetical protein
LEQRALLEDVREMVRTERSARARGTTYDERVELRDGRVIVERWPRHE